MIHDPWRFVDRRQRDRRRPPKPGINRLFHILVCDQTGPAEFILAMYTLIRGSFVMWNPHTAFGPVVTESLKTIMPIRAWALTGIFPGLIQVIGLMIGGRFRRHAAYSNVGILWMIAVLWALTVPAQLGVVNYIVLGLAQLYVALRLAMEPDR